MQRQTVCAFTDWLNGVDANGNALAAPKGINDFLPLVPRDLRDITKGGQLLPPPKSVALIADPYRDDDVADFTAKPKKLPAVYVLPDGPVQLEGEAGPVDRKANNVAIAARVIIENPNKASSLRYADYVQRAIEMSLAAFLAEDNQADAARTREGIRIVSCNAIVSGPWRESVGEAMAVAIVGASFKCRDQQPRG